MEQPELHDYAYMTHNLSQNMTILDFEEQKFGEFNGSLEDIENWESMYSQVYIPIFVILVIVSNLVVVLSSGLLFKEGMEPRCTYMLLGNISLADLITACVVIVGWFKVEAIFKCTVHLSIYIMCMLSSTLSVGVIAIDRYIYILHGIKYKQIMYPRRVRYLLYGTWIIGFLGGFIPLSIFGKESPVCWFNLVAPTSIILSTATIGIIPLVCTIVIYCIILHKAIKNVKKLKLTSQPYEKGKTEGLRIYVGKSRQINTLSKTIDETDNQANKINNISVNTSNNKSKRDANTQRQIETSSNPNKWKAIKVVIFTTMTHSVAWMPYYITSAIYALCDKENTPKECNDFLINVTSAPALLTFVCTFTNPIIYAWWHNRFRESLKKTFSKYMRLYNLKTKIWFNHNANKKKEESTHL